MNALALAVLLACAASAATPREQLNAVVAQVAKDPADTVLRRKAIALAGKLKPAPSVPLEAKRAFVMAATYQKEAKSPAAFLLAVDAFRDASRLAPWWGDAYYNLSVSLESAGRLGEAKDALDMYLLTNPKDAEAAQNRLFALEAKAKLAATETASRAGAADAAASRARVEASIEGAWWRVYESGNSDFEHVIVTRAGGSFDVKFVALGGPPVSVTDFTATETTLRLTTKNTYSTVTDYDLRREGAQLVGTHTSNFDTRIIPVRFIRK